MTDATAPQSGDDADASEVRKITPEEAADLAEAILDHMIVTKGGTRRPGQVQMARSVARSLTAGKPHLVQGGTGIGKTLGYLAGALASGKQTCLTPHTKALQDQIAGDLDLMISAFSTPEGQKIIPTPSYGVIKGRSSYVCLAKVAPQPAGDVPLDGLDGEAPFTPSSALGQEVKALHDWANETSTGERTHLPFTVTSKAWRQVSTTADDCTGKRCPLYEQCFVTRARRQAAESSVIVANQAYLATHMKVPHLLPDTVEAIIVDEAHEFPDVVAHTFGAEVTIKRLEGALDALAKVARRSENDNGGGKEDARVKGTTKAIRVLDDAVPAPKFADRGILTKPEVLDALDGVLAGFTSLRPAVLGMPDTNDQEKGAKELLQRRLDNVIFDLRLILLGTTDKQVVWVEPRGDQAVMCSAQFDVGDTIYERLLYEFRSVVFTSATLSIGGEFDLIAQANGFAKGPWTGEIVESPFDYPAQGRVWMPEGIPEPGNTPEKKVAYSAAVAKVAEKTVRAAGGRTLVLCTSWESVNAVSEHLRTTLGGKFPIITQSRDTMPMTLAKQFAEDPRAVLVGTTTFWTGVSVDGDTCAAVVIDKMPFPSPSIPIIAAQTEKADRERGRGAGFKEVSLVKAILAVVQGGGRLIRTLSDRGVVVLCDPRVHDSSALRKFYARQVLRSLPPFRFTTDEAEVLAFLGEIDRTANDERGGVVVIEEEADQA